MKLQWGSGIVAALAAGFLLSGGSCSAQILYFVDNSGDSGPGSLRQAILNANAHPGPDGIEFSFLFTPVTITLTSGTIPITDDLEILGLGSSSLIVTSNGKHEVFNITANTVTIRDLSIVNGSGGLTGAILNRGNLSLVNCSLSNNSGYKGCGAIDNVSGSLSVANSSFTGNYAGAICNFSGSVTVTGSSFTGNDGSSSVIENGSGSLMVTDSVFTDNETGAVTNSSGTVTITRVSITGNSRAALGGAIYNRSGVVTVTDATLSKNFASFKGGAIFNDVGSVVLTGGVVTGNNAGSGGGIYNETGSVTVADSVIAGNFTGKGQGGGIYNGLGTAVVTNSTLSTNTAFYEGGGIYSAGVLSVTGVTISGNYASTGGGIWGPATLRNTLLTGSPRGGNCDDSPKDSLGHNLSSDDTCARFLTNLGDRSEIDPLLGPLADNGGSTLTHALLPGSPAIDAGDDAGAPPTDQRKTLRIQDGDGDGIARIDIGAFEAPKPPPPPPPDCFDFHVPGYPSSTLRLCQGAPPVLNFHLVGSGGYVRNGTTRVLSLLGAGTILSVGAAGRQVVVHASNGYYVSRDGFLYAKLP